MKFYLLLAAFAVLSAFADQEYPVSDSGIHGPKYVEILALMDTLSQSNPGLVSVVEYGKSVSGRPLRMLILKNSSLRIDHRPTFLMSGSTHGNEYLNIEDRLPVELIKLATGSSRNNPVARFVDSGGAYVFVPILNPDGYEDRTRENANGADLNRDWDVEPASFKGFKQVETRLLAEKLEALHTASDSLDYKVTVDYHCCAGALLYPWAYSNKKLPQADLQRHMAIADLGNAHLKIDTGISGDILGYNSMGTTKDYYYSHYGAIAFTYEGRFNQEKQLFDEHVAWWQDMAAYVVQTVSKPLLTLFPGKRRSLFRLAD